MLPVWRSLPFNTKESKRSGARYCAVDFEFNFPSLLLLGLGFKLSLMQDYEGVEKRFEINCKAPGFLEGREN